MAEVMIEPARISMLFEKALTKEHCKLTNLSLHCCSLTDQCIAKLCNALQDERCRLTNLTLENNAIGDKGARMLFENVLTKEHCKLTKLDLSKCSLTDQCIPSLLEALQDEHCGLVKLQLWGNGFTEDGKRSIREVRENCKERGLNIGIEDNIVKDGPFQ